MGDVHTHVSRMLGWLARWEETPERERQDLEWLSDPGHWFRRCIGEAECMRLVSSIYYDRECYARHVDEEVRAVVASMERRS